MSLTNTSDYTAPTTLCILPPTTTHHALTLDDCLACAGCITAEEHTRIEKQSHTQIKRRRRRRNKNGEITGKTIVITSPQSRAALKSHLGINNETNVQKCIQKMVEWKMEELEYETDQREDGNHTDPDNTAPDNTQKSHTRLRSKSPVSTTQSKDTNSRKDKPEALSAVESEVIIVDENIGREILFEMASRKQLEHPDKLTFTSACPAWITYVEKQHPELIPHIQQLKSPMAITAAAYRSLYQDAQIIAIMQCPDKKLETLKYQHTDIVLTTSEFLTWTQAVVNKISSIDFDSFSLDQRNNYLHPGTNQVWNRPGTSAGGMLNLLHQVVHHTPLQLRPVRPKNFNVCVSQEGDFASVYGFKNIQNLVRKWKSGKLPYKYIEVMACSGACANGGGQGTVDYSLVESTYQAQVAVTAPDISELFIWNQWRSQVGMKKLEEECLSSLESDQAEDIKVSLQW